MDTRFVDHKTKKVWAVEMSCPWIEHREKKSEERTELSKPPSLDFSRGIAWELNTVYVSENFRFLTRFISLSYII